MAVLHIEAATVVEAYKLDVTFDDGTQKVVDIEPLLWGPMFEPLKDPEVFAQVRVDPVARTVVWPNGADLAPDALYALPAKAAPASS